MNNLENNIVNKDKMFYIYSSELEGRLDPFYYQPSIRELENKVRKQSTKKLRNYISKISSGATPSVKEEEKYYSDKENGIPFLRVQNLQANGKINLEDVKYINNETHDKQLKRSQVAEHDLLVKITGVGRMAIASVAPDNFVGNTNQHMVVIKTDNKEVNEYLSNYLNLDFVEKLASRRTTGGTRPALDYPALKSIPIIEGIDFTKIVEAEKEKSQKEKEAENLLDSIDNYLLSELGISIPEEDNSLQARIFSIDFNEISGERFDIEYNKSFYRSFFNNLRSGIFHTEDLGQHIILRMGAIINTSEYTPIGVPIIRIQNITEDGLVLKDLKYIDNSAYSKYKLAQIEKGDLLFGMSGTIGRVGIVLQDVGRCILNQRIARILVKRSVNKRYLQAVLNSEIGRIQFTRIGTGGMQTNISNSDIRKLRIPLPSFEKQTEIALHIKSIRDRAKLIQEEANNILNQAKTDLQNSILNQ